MDGDTQLRLAIIGCGDRGLAHASAAVATDLYEVVAVADLDAGRRTTLADAYGVRRRYGDYREMLAQLRGEIDVVHLCTQPSLRTPPVRDALAAGVRAIVIEKPMELSYSAAMALEAACAEAGALLVVNHQTRYMREWVALKRSIAAGQIGDPLMLRANCSNLLNQGTHMLDMAWNVLGEPVLRWVLGGCDSRPTSQPDHPCPRTALALVDFGNSVRGCFIFADTDAQQFLPPATQGYGGYNMEVRGSAGVAQAILGHGFRRWDRAGDLVESFSAHWDDANVGLAQQQLSRDVALALRDAAFKHPLRGESALVSFALVEAVTGSGLTNATISLPLATGQDVLARWSRSGRSD
jgi:predicted dehydrogenase